MYLGKNAHWQRPRCVQKQHPRSIRFQWTDLWYSHYSSTNSKKCTPETLMDGLDGYPTITTGNPQVSNEFAFSKPETFHSKRLHCQLEAPASFEIQWWCHRTTQRPEDVVAEMTVACLRKWGSFKDFGRNSTASCYKIKIYQINTYQNCIYSQSQNGKYNEVSGQFWSSHQNGLAKYLAILSLSIAADIRTTLVLLGAGSTTGSTSTTRCSWKQPFHAP